MLNQHQHKPSGAGHFLPVRWGRLFCWGLIFKILIVFFLGGGGGQGHFLIREYYLGVIINFMKVAQSSNEHELKLNAAAVSSKHRSIDNVCGELWHDL